MTAEAPEPTFSSHGTNTDWQERICDLMAQGHSLKKACEHEGMPEPSYVYRIARKDPEFKKTLGEARIALVETREDKFYDLEEEIRGCTDLVKIQGLRLISDNLKFALVKVLRKTYGDTPAEVHATTNLTANFLLTPEAVAMLQGRRKQFIEQLPNRSEQ